MINLDKEKYQGATSDKINNYNWILKEKVVKILDPITENFVVLGRNSFDIWDPLELKTYIHDSIQ